MVARATIGALDTYVFFSYLPRFSEATLKWLDCDFDSDFGKGVEDGAWWVNEGVRAWKETMAGQVSLSAPSATHVIPLSGGLDSRAILGGLIENLPQAQIAAVTYGIPGSWDFEIGRLVARKFGLQHEALNLLDVKWDLDQLVDVAASLTGPVDVHQCYLRHKINEHFGASCTYWSGFLGDVLAGADLPRVQNTDKKQAVRRFIDLYPTPNFGDQSFRDEILEKIHSECPWESLGQRKYGLDQQMDIFVRQRYCHQPIVVASGYDFKTPFLAKRWLSYISNVPYRWLLGKQMYKHILMEGYRELYRLPATSNYGLPLASSKTKVFLSRVKTRVRTDIQRFFNKGASHPRTNYINWAESLRQEGDFRNLVYANLQDLIKLGIYPEVDVNRWWENHMTRKQNNTTLLMNLSSLNVLLMSNRIWLPELGLDQATDGNTSRF